MAINKKYVLCCPLILALSNPTPKDGTVSEYSLPPVTFRRTACRTAKEDKIQPVNLLPEKVPTLIQIQNYGSKLYKSTAMLTAHMANQYIILHIPNKHNLSQMWIGKNSQSLTGSSAYNPESNICRCGDSVHCALWQGPENVFCKGPVSTQVRCCWPGGWSLLKPLYPVVM